MQATSLPTLSPTLVCVDISSVPREKSIIQLLTYPRFPLRENEEPVVQKTLSVPERKLYELQCVDEETVINIEKETRDQSNSVRWKLDRKYSRLPITRTLANSNCALTRTKIDFPRISVIHSL